MTTEKKEPRTFTLHLLDGYFIEQESMDSKTLLQVVPKAEYQRLSEENAELKQKVMLSGIGAGHFKSERDIHIAESETFVKEATAKIRELEEANKRLVEAVKKLKEQRDHRIVRYLTSLEVVRERNYFDGEIEKILNPTMEK
jgi:hypothetical protein